MRIMAAVIVCTVSLSPARAEIIDRIAVTVGNSVITDTQIRREIRLTAFLNKTQPDFSPLNRRRAAERLIEQTIIRRELGNYGLRENNSAVTDAEVQKMMRERYPDPAGLGEALARYQLAEQDLAAHLRWLNTLLGFIDARFRPGVQVPESELREYYRDFWAPEWQKRYPGPPPPFDEARDRVESIMMAERANNALDRWLGQMRTQVRIRYHMEAFR